MNIHGLNLSSLATYTAAMVANWRMFGSFYWNWSKQGIDDPDLWSIIYTHNRDSTLIDESNASAIDKAMASFVIDGSAYTEDHNHWAVGWIKGYSVRVYGNDGQPTPAIAAMYAIACQLEQYPILDETDYSERESEATYENISNEIAYYCRKHDLNLDESLLYDAIVNWYDHNEPNAIESVDDQGGYLSSVQIHKAMIALGYVVES